MKGKYWLEANYLIFKKNYKKKKKRWPLFNYDNISTSISKAPFCNKILYYCFLPANLSILSTELYNIVYNVLIDCYWCLVIRLRTASLPLSILLYPVLVFLSLSMICILYPVMFQWNILKKDFYDRRVISSKICPHPPLGNDIATNRNVKVRALLHLTIVQD